MTAHELIVELQAVPPGTPVRVHGGDVAGVMVPVWIGRVAADPTGRHESLYYPAHDTDGAVELVVAHTGEG